MAKYVRLDKISANAHLESVVCASDLENGFFLELGDLQADGEARAVTKSADVEKGLVFHHSVPLIADETKDEMDFVLSAGKVGRAYVLQTGDIISVSEDGIDATAGDDGELAVDQIVVPDATTGLAVSAESATGLQGKIIALETDAIAGVLAVIRIQA